MDNRRGNDTGSGDEDRLLMRDQQQDSSSSSSSSSSSITTGQEQPHNHQQQQQQPKHVRPKIRQRVTTSATSLEPKTRNVGTQQQQQQHNSETVVIEETRQRMESWMGLGRTTQTETRSRVRPTVVMDVSHASVTENEMTLMEDSQSQSTLAVPVASRPTGILKVPKYSKKQHVVDATDSSSRSYNDHNNNNKGELMDDDIVTAAGGTAGGAAAAAVPPVVVCKDVIVERDPSQPIPKRKPFRKPNMEPQTIDDILLAGKQYQQQEEEDEYHPLIPQLPNHNSVEGYVPSITTMQPQSTAAAMSTSSSSSSSKAAKNESEDTADNGNNDDGDDDDDDNEDSPPLYIHSLAELMEAAGKTLPPPTTPIAAGDLIEANLEFSVMTQQEYDANLSKLKQQQQQDLEQQMQIFMGKPSLFPDDSTSSEDENNPGNDDEDEDEGDDSMEFDMGNGCDENYNQEHDGENNDDTNNIIQYDDEDDNRPEPDARAFRLLWQALTDWMTPHTVSWLRKLRACDNTESSIHNNNNMDNEWTPVVDRSDIGSSRCAGVMAMLKLYLSGCMEELHFPSEQRRRAEKRLTDLLRTFDYSRENPKLHVSHWKAMTCILLDMVMTRDVPPTCDNNGTIIQGVPPSVSVLGMSLDEYRYLSQKTIQTFDCQ